MKSEKIINFSVKASIFRTLSLLMGLGIVGSFLFLCSETSSIAWKEELTYKATAIVLLFVFGVLYSIFHTLSDVYKKRVEMALEYKEKKGRRKIEMELLEKELKESREARDKKIIVIDIPLDD